METGDRGQGTWGQGDGGGGGGQGTWGQGNRGTGYKGTGGQGDKGDRGDLCYYKEHVCICTTEGIEAKSTYPQTHTKNFSCSHSLSTKRSHYLLYVHRNLSNEDLLSLSSYTPD